MHTEANRAATDDPYDISILYVEDEPAIREGYARALKRIARRVTLAANGAEGLQRYRETRPDIVISDIRMPEMDGIAMLREIRKIDPESYVIFTTAYSDCDYMLQAMEHQVFGYLLKPVQKQHLRAKIAQIVTLMDQARQLREQQQLLEAQREMMQNILDHDQNLKIITDFKSLLYANRAFLALFDAESVEAFNARICGVGDIFLPMPGYLHSGLLEPHEHFYDLVCRTDPADRMITLIGSDGEPRAFYINITPMRYKGDETYLIALTDITMINIQKLSTEKKAYHDNLTGIYNRNKFDELCSAEINRVRRYGTPCSLVILDIDHFKRFNDTYGHLVGDKVLRTLAETITRNIRNTDIFARWGGEEFVLLLPETPLASACKLVEKLRLQVAHIVMEECDGITASFGVTQLHREDTIKRAIARADQALYEAKAAGRNCVKCAAHESDMKQSEEPACAI